VGNRKFTGRPGYCSGRKRLLLSPGLRGDHIQLTKKEKATLGK